MNLLITDINEAMRKCFANNAKVFPKVLANHEMRLSENVNGRLYTHKEKQTTATINDAISQRYLQIANKL